MAVIISGWWYTYPLKHMKVSWDDYSQSMEIIKFMFQTTNQILLIMVNRMINMVIKSDGHNYGHDDDN